MDYATVDGVVQRTGYADKTDWYLLFIKESLDNSIDALWEKYPGSSDALVTVGSTISDKLFHVKVRNSNPDNIPTGFQNLSAIFDYDMTYGSKQNRHIISRGLLGDALKQIGTWPYVLMHTEDNGRAFTDTQWEKPLIIRANKVEHHVIPHIDKANQRIGAKPTAVSDKLRHTDTEIETTWPIIDEVRNTLDIRNIERFCRQSIIFTTDISFKFRLIDNSIRKTKKSDSRKNISSSKNKNEILSELSGAITGPAPKAAIEIDAPALHSISSTWNNTSSIHSFNPEEFVAAFTGVHDKTNTKVYDVLRRFKEGTQIPKTRDTEKSVAQLMKDRHRDKKIESLFRGLHKILRSPERISLPYSHIKTIERKKALIDRILPLYPTRDYFDTGKAVYRLVHGSYKDDTDAALPVQYPFAFEIIAIPLSDKILRRNTNRPSEFIGAVNYSISPRSNRFEGDYKWLDKKLYYTRVANDIQGILEECRFEFGEYSGPKVKLPCVIAANLVSPRIDYKGKSKSDIDTQPFSGVIVEAVTKVASEIQTFRAAGYEFYTEREFLAFTKSKKQVKTVKDVVEEVLRGRKEEVGL
jgi:hypothetical protein